MNTIHNGNCTIGPIGNDHSASIIHPDGLWHLAKDNYGFAGLTSVHEATRWVQKKMDETIRSLPLGRLLEWAPSSNALKGQDRAA